ncbi:MAG: peptidylprolyl isomerase [Phycisphaerales bacterium]
MIAPSLRKPAGLLFVVASFLGSGAMAQDTQPAAAPVPVPAPAPTPAPVGEKLVTVRMTTNMGDMVIELDAEKAPVTVANFLKYADGGFYNDTVFHRVIPGFMIQGGGFGLGLIEKPTEAPIVNEWMNGLKNVKYSLAMARKPDPHSATAQFFINTVDNPRLDGSDEAAARALGGAGYAVFGKVIAGTGVVDAIKSVPTRNEQAIGFQPTPIEPVVITKVERLSSDGVEEAKKTAEASVEKAQGELKRRMDARMAMENQARQRFMDSGKALGTPEEQFTKAMDFIKAKSVDIVPGSKSDSGLWSLELTPGQGAQPTLADTVKVHYSGWLVNGSPFDSSVTRGVPLVMPMQQFVKGWQEGIGAMKVGSKRWLVVPQELGYGEMGRPPIIPPAATLIFEVELIEVIGK